MSKGFFAGIFWGLIFAVVSLAILSLQLDLASLDGGRIESPSAEVEAPAVAVAPESAAEDTDEGASEPTMEADAASAQAEGGMTSEASEVVTDSLVDPEAEEIPEGETLEVETPPSEEDAGSSGGLGALSGPAKIKSEPVKPIGNLVDGVETSRLPSIAAAPGEGDAAAEVGDPLSLAIERNAAPFENPEGRPLMAILLKDMGASRSNLGDLKNLPFPISFIVDASAEDAQEAIAFYRAAGAEVVVQAVLPDGATPTDAEVNFQAQSELIAQGVAVFMAPESGFQTDAPLARQISDILVSNGHGLVSMPQGLNTGHKNALKSGVMAGLVFRVLDANGEDGSVMRRFLDNAAFKAGQENGVIMMGQAQEQTITALIEWSLGNRVKSVAMAPVSALLLGG